ncbi:MAG: hypothetical protein ABIG39_07335 [Candidatus Micrarchaeota archaeon]
MDQQPKNIIKKKLQKWGNIRLTKDNLRELREAISDATGHNKFASFTNVRKWVSQVKKDMKKEASTSKKEKPKSKREPAAKKDVAVSMAIISDRIFLQTIGYEIAAIRRSMDRINSQLTEVEKKLSLKKEA